MKRGLTENEVALLQPIFKDAIDYAQVKLVFDAWWQRFSRAAVAPRGVVYFPKVAECTDFAQASASLQVWFVHEMTHVWQYHRGFSVAWSGVCLFCQGGYIQSKAYRYWSGKTVLPAFCDLNMEQQAEVVAHYFAAERLGYSQWQQRLPQLATCIAPLLSNPHHLCLLPQHSRCHKL